VAENVKAPIDVPPFDRATMDGYAVVAEDTYGAGEGNPKPLKIAGKVTPGEEPKVEVAKGTAAEISTGAPIPPGADAVVMVEYTRHEKNYVNIYRAVTPGENVMAAGSDIVAGETILRRGTVLTPRETGVLAALGITHIQCLSRPKVAVLSTGDEITAPGEALEYGRVYDINGRTLCHSIAECGCEPFFMGVAKDDPVELELKIVECLQRCDVTLVSGGTSAGLGDLLYRVVDGLGSPGILVHGVSVKPGKPTIIAVVGGKLRFGLPGCPTSALIIFNIFIRPVLRQMAGLGPEVELASLEAKLGIKIHSAPGRREYIPVSLIQAEGGERVAYPIPGGSGAITTLSKADGFVEIPEGRLILEEGQPVKVRLFSPEIRSPNLVVIGSHCLGLDLLLDLMQESMPQLNPKVINIGSSGGLAALGRGEADVAGIHLLDAKSGEYNTPYLERHGVAAKVALIHGYRRRQGLLLPRGNPKGIRGLDDLLRGEISVINRNRGSGTRLIEYLLQKLARERGADPKELTSQLRGHQSEARSDTAIAVAVARGKADVGFAVESAAHQYNLDFIPIAEEHYDFAILASRFADPAVKLFVETLRSETFKSRLSESHPGLIPSENTGKIIHHPLGWRP